VARTFNGSSDAFGSSAAVNISAAGTGAITLSFFLWWDSFGNDDQLALELSANYNSNAGSFIINPNSSGAGAFEYSHSNGAGGYRSGNFTRPSAAAWHHYMLVMDTTDTLLHVAYVDGSVVTTNVGANGGGATWNAGYTLYGMSRAAGALFGDGRMAELAIWTSALTSGNASSLAGGTLASAIGTPAYYWKMCGTDSPEPATVGSPSLTLTNTTGSAHPAAVSGSCVTGGTARQRLVDGGLIGGRLIG
jgi:hypothetical protein